MKHLKHINEDIDDDELNTDSELDSDESENEYELLQNMFDGIKKEKTFLKLASELVFKGEISYDTFEQFCDDNDLIPETSLGNGIPFEDEEPNKRKGSGSPPLRDPHMDDCGSLRYDSSGCGSSGSSGSSSCGGSSRNVGC